jgi:tetratricopeptide (TPR) repeat protein
MTYQQRPAEAKQHRHFLQRASLSAQEMFADAVQHHRVWRLNEAVACYLRALELRPNYPEAHNNLGSALQAQGGLDEAVACYRRALELRPDYLEAHNNLGSALQAQGWLDEAIICYRRALKLKPDLPDINSNLGLALKEQGRLDEAIACCRRALELRPNYPEAHNNLGAALQAQGRLEEAVTCYRRAIDFRPDFPIAHNNLGFVLREQARLDEAVICHRRAIELRPDYPEAYSNLGIALQNQGQLDEAMACHRRAVDLRPNFPEAHLNLAGMLLARGDMLAGWEEYEWRWKTSQMVKGHRSFAQPQWHGGATEGQTLLIHAEQGFGDTLQFCRYAPLAAGRRLRVIMEVQKPLVRLLRCLPGIDLVMGRGEALPPFDLHCPMLSMPLALGTTLATIPSAPSYLHADEARVEVWRKRLATIASQGSRVGLVWAGTAMAAADRRRSVAPGRLAPLFELSELQFFSLQKDGPPAPADFPLSDFMDEMDDFADTAALIANLDLVISVDTAIAHLAAALGRPVWMLDRFDPDWRWLVGRRDSPWYPTLRLYRQPRPGDWESVLAEVARDLHSFAEARKQLRIERGRSRATEVVTCKICGAIASSCGAVDFNKNCEVRRGLALPDSGTQIPYWRCGQCGFVFTNAFDSWTPRDYKREIYNEEYCCVDPDYEVIRPLGSAGLIEQLFAESKTALAILDYGGGNGSMAKDLMNRGFNSACTYDPFVERYAKLPKAQFDLVCCFETLEHVPDPMATIGQICSLVKPDGMVVFSTLLQPEKFNLDWWYLAPRNGHIGLFSQTALSMAWAQHGFRVFSWNSNLHAAFRVVPKFAPMAIQSSLCPAGQKRTSPSAQMVFSDAVQHHRAWRLNEAVACYRRALELSPDYPEAHNNLGSALQAQGRLDEAVTCYRRALELRPDYPEAHNNLGSALQAQGRLDEAVTCYRRALKLKPDLPDVNSNLGLALKKQGRLDEAVACCRRALELRPNYPEAHNNLGSALQALGRLDEAVTCYRRAQHAIGAGHHSHDNSRCGILFARRQWAGGRVADAARGHVQPWSSNRLGVGGFRRRRGRPAVVIGTGSTAVIVRVAWPTFPQPAKRRTPSARQLPIEQLHERDGRFRRHCGFDRQPRSCHFGRYRRRPFDGETWQAGLDAGPVRSRLALAYRPARQPVVPDAAHLPSAAPGRLGPRPGRDRPRPA